MSGGVTTLTCARKLAKARTFPSNCEVRVGVGVAALADLARPSAAASPQNVTACPSGCGANIRTSGVIDARGRATRA